MITVNIIIDGDTIYSRTAVDRLKENECYVLDTGERVLHNPGEGVVVLATKMLNTIYDNPEELTLCENCLSMSKTWHGTCTKCRCKKRKI